MTSVTIPMMVETLCAALMRHNTGEAQARAVADALILAEIDGKKGHGLARLPHYAKQAQSGKVDGHALPTSKTPKPAFLAVDAHYGFAYPALDLVLEKLPELAKKQGVAIAGITHSHHFGVAGHHVERAADHGMMALLLGNTPPAMAPWGGKKPLFGTNPIAFATPVKNHPPIVIDLATSVIARGTIVMAHQRGESIPQGWALDAEGLPTTDPAAALNGTMLPIGEAKGAALALMVEILAATLTGAGFSHQASSFLNEHGAPPNVGQVIIMIDPQTMASDCAERIADLCGLIADDGGRIPGERRIAKRQTAQKDGIEIDDALWQEISQMASAQS